MIVAEGKRLAEQQNDPRVLVGLLYGYGVSAYLLGGRNALSMPIFEEAIAIASSTHSRSAAPIGSGSASRAT